ncbi:hypothetical protein Tco_0784990 [Tanacetum coccineum]
MNPRKKKAKNIDTEIALEKKVNIKPIDYAELNQLSEDFGKRFVLQQELSDEQALHPIIDQSASSPVKIEAHQELPKVSLVNTSLKKLKTHHGQFNNVVKKRITPNALTEGELDVNTSVKVNSSVVMNDSINYVEVCNKSYHLRKFKGKDIVNSVALVSNATTIAPGMYKLDPVVLAPKVKNNREAHEYYLKHTMEQAVILREIVEQAYSLNPLDNASYSVCNTPKASNRPLLSSTGVNPSTSASGSKPSGNTKNDRILRTPSSNEMNKVEVQSRKVKSSLNKRKS